MPKNKDSMIIDKKWAKCEKKITLKQYKTNKLLIKLYMLKDIFMIKYIYIHLKKKRKQHVSIDRER